MNGSWVKACIQKQAAVERLLVVSDFPSFPKVPWLDGSGNSMVWTAPGWQVRTLRRVAGAAACSGLLSAVRMTAGHNGPPRIGSRSKTAALMGCPGHRIDGRALHYVLSALRMLALVTASMSPVTRWARTKDLPANWM